MTMKDVVKNIWTGEVVQPSLLDMAARIEKQDAILAQLLEAVTQPKLKAQDAPAVKVNKTVEKQPVKSFVTSTGYTVHKDPDENASEQLRKNVWSYTHVDNTNQKMTNREAHEIISSYHAKAIKSFQGPGWKTTKAGLSTQRKPGRPSQASQIDALLKQNAELIALLKSKA